MSTGISGMLGQHRTHMRGCGRTSARFMAALIAGLLVLMTAQAYAHDGGHHHPHSSRRLAASPTFNAGGRRRCGTQTTAVQAQSANKVVAQSLKSGKSTLAKGTIKVQVRCAEAGCLCKRVCSEQAPQNNPTFLCISLLLPL